ncbi:MAG: cupin domain-containing protein [Chloroflexi bacterium]|nr:cupin domain-containing protein [Chloroflexota bacterium]
MATETDTTPKTSTFSLKGPYLSEGRVNIDLARTDTMWLSLKVNAEGGENAIHAHMNEDHAFLVLEGEVTFYDENGGEKVCGQYEGINIPKGAFYRYLNTGDRNLFLLRFGCKLNSGGTQESRLKPDGTSIPSNTVENHHVDGVPIPGKFFGAK